MSQSRQAADAWARYAALITAQIEALDRDEFEMVGMLGQQREQLAGEIEELDLDGTEAADLAEIRQQMATCSEADQLLRQRLDELHQENVAGTRRVDRWRKALNVYSSRGRPGSAAIDVKL